MTTQATHAPAPTFVAGVANADLAAFILRISLGGLFLVHGLVKLLVFTPAGTAAFFSSLGFPGVLGYVVMAAEVLGGLALILGLWSRWVALALLPIMLGALYVHFGAGFTFSNPGGGWEFPAFWAATLIVQALLGDGAYALRRSGG